MISLVIQQVININMHGLKNDDISPWEHTQTNIFSINYEQHNNAYLNNNQNKKISAIPHIKQIPAITKRRNFAIMTKQLSQHDIVTKNQLFSTPSSTKSQETIISQKSERFKISRENSKLFGSNRSSLIQSNNYSQLEQVPASNFSIKRFSRVKRFSKFSLKQMKADQIFRKFCEFQNPVHRQNVNLPKIQIKM